MESTHAYIGKDSCGCVMAVTVDMQENEYWKNETAKTVAEFIREGLTVERHPIEDVRRMELGHKCDKESGL